MRSKIGLENAMERDLTMITRPVITLRRRRILIDIDTQNDMLTSEGLYCIRNHRRVLANIRRVMAWSRHKNIRVISTTQINGVHPETGTSFCVGETAGKEKISYTLRHNHVFYPADGSTDLPRDIFKQYDQVVVEKRTTNPFEEPRADRILSELKADEFIIIGTAAEGAIVDTVLGLLNRRKNVTVLTDAVGYVDKNTSEIAMRKMEAKGAKMVESKILFGPSHLRYVYACGCDRCLGKFQKEAAYVRTGT